MGFFALVLALLIERLRPLRPGNRLRTTIGRLARSVRVRLDRGRRRDGVIGWVLVMTISLLAVVLAESLAAGLHPVFVFALHVFVLYCTIGFRQFSEAFTEIRVAFAADDAAGAGRILATWVRDSDAGEAPVLPEPAGRSSETCRKAVAHALLIAHRQVLGPLFCYIVIPGAAGPLLYRVAETLARHWRRGEDGDLQSGATAAGYEAESEFDRDEEFDVVDLDERDVVDREFDPREFDDRDLAERSPGRLDVDPLEPPEPAYGLRESLESAQRVEPAATSPWGVFAVSAFEAIDWLPVRLSAGGFAVVGNFEEALYCWRAAVAAGLRDARTLLLAAGGGALGLRLADVDAAGLGVESATAIDPPGSEARPASLQAAAGLVWRSLLMWIGLYALITVSAWMGS